MTRANIRQADMERLIRAAGRQGAALQIDMRTLIATVVPAAGPALPIDSTQTGKSILHQGDYPPDGKDIFDED